MISAAHCSTQTRNRQSISSCDSEIGACPRLTSAESSSLDTSSMSSSSYGAESSPASGRSSVSASVEHDMNIVTPPLKAKGTATTENTNTPTTEDENEEEDDSHHDSFSFNDDDVGVVGQTYECEIQGFEESFASFEMDGVDTYGDDDRGRSSDFKKQEASISHIEACFDGRTDIKTLNNSGDCPPAVPSRGPSRRRSSSRGRLHSSGSDLAPSRPKRCEEDDGGDDGEMGGSSDSRRGRLARNKSTKVTTPGGRRRSGPGGAMAMSCSALNFDASFSAGCPRTPLSRERSKLCRLSGSNSTLNSSSHSGASRGSRGSTQRRRASQLPPSIDTVMNTSNSTYADSKFDGSASCAIMNFDGDSSVAQLQVGDFFMLANKELSTSSHLRRRMPRRHPRRTNRSAHSTSASATDGDENDEGNNKNDDNDAHDVGSAENLVQEAIGVVDVQESCENNGE